MPVSPWCSAIPLQLSHKSSHSLSPRPAAAACVILAYTVRSAHGTVGHRLRLKARRGNRARRICALPSTTMVLSGAQAWWPPVAAGTAGAVTFTQVLGADGCATHGPETSRGAAGAGAGACGAAATTAATDRARCVDARSVNGCAVSSEICERA